MTESSTEDKGHKAPEAAVALPEDQPDTGRYSAYDNRLARYVGGVHDTEAKARKAAKDAGSADVTIRQV